MRHEHQHDHTGQRITSYRNQSDRTIRPHYGKKFVPPHIQDDPLYYDEEIPRQQEEKQHSTAHRQRMSAKKKQKQRSKQHKLRAAFAAVAVIVIWLFLRLAPVPFGSVVIDGNEQLTAEDIYRSSNIWGYVNVVQLSTDTIQERLAKDLRIQEVTVTREFPATIRIAITERKPVAVVTTMYGFAFVDAVGTVIDIQPQIKGVSVPIVTGKRMDTLLLGDTITDGSLYAALAYMQHLTPELQETVAEINVGNPENIVVYTKDSLPIHLGRGDNPDQRAALTEALLKEVKEKRLAVQYIDTDIQNPLAKGI